MFERCSLFLHTGLCLMWTGGLVKPASSPNSDLAPVLLRGLGPVTQALRSDPPLPIRRRLGSACQRQRMSASFIGSLPVLISQLGLMHYDAFEIFFFIIKLFFLWDHCHASESSLRVRCKQMLCVVFQSFIFLVVTAGCCSFVHLIK